MNLWITLCPHVDNCYPQTRRKLSTPVEKPVENPRVSGMSVLPGLSVSPRPGPGSYQLRIEGSITGILTRSRFARLRIELTFTGIRRVYENKEKPLSEVNRLGAVVFLRTKPRGQVPRSARVVPWRSSCRSSACRSGEHWRSVRPEPPRESSSPGRQRP